MNSAQLLADIRSLREETRIDSITPDRVGKILEYLLQTGDDNMAAIVQNIISLADNQTVLSDDNILSSLRSLAEIDKKSIEEIRKRILSLSDTQTVLSDDNFLSSLRSLAEIEKISIEEISKKILSLSDTQTVLSDDNFLSSLRSLAEIEKKSIEEIQKRILSLSDTESEFSDSNILSSLRTVAEIQQRALSRLSDDTAAGLIRFLQGLEIGNFSSGALGAGAALKMENGISSLEVDKLTVRMLATFVELIISKVSHIGGQLILSPARMKCTRVEEMETAYRCYFNKGENSEVMNEFIATDQARCQVFSGSGLKFYWRLVTAAGADYIDLSKTDCAAGSGIPTPGDDIVQLGNRSTSSRQSAQILSTVGSDAPSYKQYGGINSFSLEGKELTVLAGTGNSIVGEITFKGNDGNFYNIADWRDNTEDSIGDIASNIPYRVEITSSNGTSFRNDVISTTLTARVYRGTEDITASIHQAAFRWTRMSSYADGDTAWNLAHRDFGSNVLNITGADVDGRAVFNCEVNI